MRKNSMSKQEKKPCSDYERKNAEAFHRITTKQRGPGAPKGNTNSLKHGTHANRFLSEEERVLFDELIAGLHTDFKFNASSDFIQVELVAIYFLKLRRAQEADDWDSAQKIDPLLRGHLKDLKTTKISREGDEPRGPETTPAEWASSLLKQWAESQKPKRRLTVKNTKTKEVNSNDSDQNRCTKTSLLCGSVSSTEGT